MKEYRKGSEQTTAAFHVSQLLDRTKGTGNSQGKWSQSSMMEKM